MNRGVNGGTVANASNNSARRNFAASTSKERVNTSSAGKSSTNRGV
eukprot:CAMPEP_0116872686 /NCGR_PEP_ID=MMETSP0463-20121206/3508_1 /TAXON_ID=181622 /ORGANISM="Strombidinopsis sp, Strain SopsisLIS2011" /LENGTH=45 /DNA_ID= /DNA_START= /DNA_END= /DNA_ORIENTATION=